MYVDHDFRDEVYIYVFLNWEPVMLCLITALSSTHQLNNPKQQFPVFWVTDLNMHPVIEKLDWINLVSEKLAWSLPFMFFLLQRYGF